MSACATLIERENPAWGSHRQHRNRTPEPIRFLVSEHHLASPPWRARGLGKRSADLGAPFPKTVHSLPSSHSRPELCDSSAGAPLCPRNLPAPDGWLETQEVPCGARACPTSVPRCAAAEPEPRGAAPSPSDDALPALPALPGRALALALGSCSAPGASGGGSGWGGCGSGAVAGRAGGRWLHSEAGALQ